MAINVQRHLIAGGVGVIDEVLDYWGEKDSQEAFRNKKDLGRLGLVALGLGLQAFMPAYANIGETLSLAATPLLVKSVAKPLRAQLKKAPVSFVARTPVAGMPVPPVPQTQPGVRRVG